MYNRHVIDKDNRHIPLSVRLDSARDIPITNHIYIESHLFQSAYTAYTHVSSIKCRVSMSYRWHYTSNLTCFMCCSVLQCVAVCCSVLQCVAVRDTVQCLFHFRFLESRNFSIHYSHTCQPVYFRGFGVRSEMDTLMGQQFTEVRVHMCRHSRPFWNI